MKFNSFDEGSYLSQQEAKMDDTLKTDAQFRDGILLALASYQECQPTLTWPDKSETSVLAPLPNRLQRKLDTIPLSTRQKGLSLLELQVCLQGRKGGMPHVGELAAALRKLGWIRRRQWAKNEGGFCAKWYPH